MSLTIGTILEGRVIKIIKMGAFIDIGNNISGFIHISELSHQYVKEITDEINVNDIVKVKIIAIHPDNKIALSIKQVSPQKPIFNKAPSQNNILQDSTSGTGASFEDMMKKFKRSSEEKMSDLKRNMVTKPRRSGKRGK